MTNVQEIVVTRSQIYGTSFTIINADKEFTEILNIDESPLWQLVYLPKTTSNLDLKILSLTGTLHDILKYWFSQLP